MTLRASEYVGPKGPGEGREDFWETGFLQQSATQQQAPRFLRENGGDS
jgi:hypothetical protein